jgi:hypothetical protein
VGSGARGSSRSRSVVGLFESLDQTSPARAIRNAGGVPLAALLASQLYFALYPLLPSVPALLVYTVGALLCAGGVGGAFLIARRLVRFRRELDGPACVWSVAGGLFAVACLWFAAGIFLPWL